MLLLEEFTDDSKLLMKKIRNFYFGDKKINADTRLELTKLWTDAFFSVHAKGEAKVLSTQLPVYFYVLKNEPKRSVWDAFGYSMDNWFGKKSAYHTDELQYLFPLNVNGISMEIRKEDDQEFSLSQDLTALWASFAKTG